MITGVNRVLQHDGRELHLQTEDLGDEAATFVVRVYDGGNVLWEKKVSYSEIVEEGLEHSELEDRVLGLMNKTLTTVGAAIQKGRLPGMKLNEPMNSGASTVADWVEEVRATSPADFAEAHPHPFLVQERDSGEAEADDDEMQFATMAPSNAGLPLADLLGTKSLQQLLVLPVTKRDGSGLVGMVHVGRAENCDLILSPGSVSKFHAFFTCDPVSGVPQVADGGSTNGTAINGRRLEAHEPGEVAPRDLLAFGADSVFRFHSPESFHDLVSLAS